MKGGTDNIRNAGLNQQLNCTQKIAKKTSLSPFILLLPSIFPMTNSLMQSLKRHWQLEERFWGEGDIWGTKNRSSIGNGFLGDHVLVETFQRTVKIELRDDNDVGARCYWTSEIVLGHPLYNWPIGEKYSTIAVIKTE